MSWPWEILERDHEIQNPLSAQKIRLLGEYLRLDKRSRVLDVACGKGAPARILARAFGSRVLGIEVRAAFADEARRRAAAEGLDALIDVRTEDASTADLGGGFDAALCLGAAFVWGTIADAAAKLVETVRAGGGVAVAEPFWREWPLPAGVDPAVFVPLDATVARFESAGLRLTGLIAATEDDWDGYESLHWRAAEEWLAAHADDPRAAELRAAHEHSRAHYLRHQRRLLGDAIFVGRTF